jgi:acylaminoacyl-peptidase
MQLIQYISFFFILIASSSHCFVYDQHTRTANAHFKYYKSNNYHLNTSSSSSNYSSASSPSAAAGGSSAGAGAADSSNATNNTANKITKELNMSTIDSSTSTTKNTHSSSSSSSGNNDKDNKKERGDTTLQIQQPRQQQQQQDALLYNSYIAAAVEISQANVTPIKQQQQQLGTTILSFIRLARDIDTNTKRQFLYNVLLSGNISTTSNTAPTAATTTTTSTVLPPTHLASNIMARIPSPSGDKVAIWIRGTVQQPTTTTTTTTTKNDNSSKKTSKQQQIVEIWTHGGTILSQQILLPTGILHEDVCVDASWFGGTIQWNAQETAMVYSAERIVPRTASFFDERVQGDPNHDDLKKEDEQETVVVGGGNVLGIGIGEHWGEKYGRTSRLDLFVVHVETKRVGRVDNVPSSSSLLGGGRGGNARSTEGGYVLGQARFSPSGKHVVYTAWDAGEGGFMPKRLGSIYCYQRHCALYQSSVERLMERLSGGIGDGGGGTKEEKMSGLCDEEFVCLTPKDRLARSPRFCNMEGEGTRLFWLSHREGFDTHGGVMGLSSMEWDDDVGAKLDSRKDIVEPVYDIVPEDDDANAFPGLFLNQLPEGFFTSKDGKFMFVTSQWRSTTKILRISTSTGEIQPILFDLNTESAGCAAATDASQSLLCMTEQNDAIVTQSEPNSPPMIGFISASSLVLEDQIQCVPSSIVANLGPISATCNADLRTFAADEKCNYTIVRVTPPHGNVSAPVEGILLLPSKSKTSRVPLIVVPHGGPHSCTPTSYIPSYAYLSEGGGYAILHVNFRGSTGFGQAALESLAGNVGSQDVLDCHYLTRHVLSQFSDCIDETRVGVCGGSHGGFLSAHLIGQYPDLFKVAAMRNPVTNIATMTTSTDIPDWCYVETLGIGSYDWTTFRGPTREDLQIMWEASRKFVS